MPRLRYALGLAVVASLLMGAERRVTDVTCREWARRDSVEQVNWVDGFFLGLHVAGTLAKYDGTILSTNTRVGTFVLELNVICADEPDLLLLQATVRAIGNLRR